MAATDFFHGIQVKVVTDGIRSISTAASSVIGIVGTAPAADESVWPIDTPVAVLGQSDLDKVGDLGTEGTLYDAIDRDMLDLVSATIIAVRVEAGQTDEDTQANILAGTDPDTGKRRGVDALLAAEAEVGAKPRLLCAPGFTHQRVTDGVLSISVDAGGSGYTIAGTTVSISGTGSGASAEVSTVDDTGAITEITVTNAGRGYTDSPSVTINGDGSSATASATIGTAKNPVAAKMQTVAGKLRAVVIPDGPNTNDAEAMAAAGDFGDKRIYIHDPWYVYFDPETATYGPRPASSRICGLIALNDKVNGWHTSPSNMNVPGISGLSREIDFSQEDASSRANVLNNALVATTIRDQGYRLWGNRTTSSDQKFAFLAHVRIQDILNDSLVAAHRWARDRNITRTYVEDVTASVNAFIARLVAEGRIAGGRCYAPPELNKPADQAAGRVVFAFDFSAYGIAEDIKFMSAMVNDYLEDVIPGAA
ncbi:phage tail sheath subtilisin-like domain-containing protein [Salinisphaera orenii]|uniref:phage tail sheath subtilisin-like domain-containing protein n=1 Tax=Salinisphaera orenii TaxID=856731 RepID=UPI0019550E27